MQARGETSEQSQEELIRSLQDQVAQLTAEKQTLQDQLARREQFIAMIAHDLRSPLAPIINYAQMLARHTCAPLPTGTASPQQQGSYPPQSTKPPQIQRHTSIIISQARRMSRLVNDLLDVSRLSTGQFTLIREQCNLTLLVEELVDQLRPVAPYHKLVTVVPDEPVQGHWDGVRLQQALGNLLDNAIKYSDEHTTISTWMRIENSRVLISVHNEGASIPSSDIGQLFRPYTRLTTLAGREGSGLGLYITKSIIDAHGGELRLEPNVDTGEEGNRTAGTTFTFALPLPLEIPE